MENKEVLETIEMFENYQFLGDISQRKKLITNYIEQLEKENAEIKSKNETLDCEIEDEKSNITLLHKQYDNEVESLKKQLQAKDKALDKAIDEIMSYQTLCPPTDYIDCKNEEQWKEWCENGID